jgi:hypothetical protein
MNLGKAVYTDNTVSVPGEAFGRKDTVFLSVASDGFDPTVVLRARWFGPQGILVQEGTQTLSSAGSKATAFHLDNPSGLALGEYWVEVFVNETPAGKKKFEVLAKPPSDK